jgi:hypothetical protein
MCFPPLLPPFSRMFHALSAVLEVIAGPHQSVAAPFS